MTAVGTSAVPPSFPLVSKLFGVSRESTGALMAIFTVSGVLMTPLLGMLADKIGRVKILIPSLAIFAFGGMMAWFADSFTTLLICRLVQGIGAASLGALNVTLIADLFSRNSQTQLMGWNNAVLSFGTALFPLLGGWLTIVDVRFPYMLPMLAIPVAVLVSRTIGNLPRSGFDSKVYFFELRAAVSDKNVLVLFLISFFTFTLLFGPFLNYLPFVISQKIFPGMSVADTAPWTGRLISVMSVFTAVVAAFLGVLARRTSHRSLLVTSMILYGLSLLGFAFAPSFPLLIACSCVFGIAQAFNQPNVQSMISRLSPEDKRGGLLSFNRTASLLGQTLGAPIFAIFSGLLGLESVFFAGAIIAIGLIGIVMILDDDRFG